jgi:hypothetical protein
MAVTTLEEFAPNIWTVQVPLSIAGAQFGTRMTLVRLDDGQIVLMAPCPIDDALEAQIRRLGPVAAVVAPNAFHYFSFMDALVRFPDATPFLAEGVAKKIGQTPPNARPLSAAPEPLWKQDLEQVAIPGSPKVNEVVFYHAASRTLILTDLCFNFDPPPKGWTGIFLRLAGAHGKLAVSRLMRSMLKDRSKLPRAIDQILAWDFDRLIVTHGQNIESGAKERFREATAGL